MEQLLGEGNFGKVFRATVQSTGAARAIKSIPKVKLKKHGQEVAIMKMIDHPNLVRLYEIFEDDENLHLVMELCTGGHLLDYIERNKSLTENETAVVMQQILRAISFMHTQKMAHRDMKAENCMIAGPQLNDRNGLKVGDFGLSSRFRLGQVWNARVGTPTHWAPEVLDRKYGQEVDVWASGVVMYHILSGELPFSDENDCQAVREGNLSFATDAWKQVSTGAVGLVSELLTDDAAERPCAKKILKSSWFNTWIPPVEDENVQPDHLERLRSFRSLNRLKRAALTVVSTMLDDRELSGYHRLFTALDMNGDGFLTIEELRLCLLKFRSSKANNLEGIFKDGIDSKKTKPFSYTEFVAAVCFTRDRQLSDSLCRATFRNFDKNGDGKLDRETLTAIGLLDDIPTNELKGLFRECDINRDGCIDFEEFKIMLRGGAKSRLLVSQASADVRRRLSRKN